MRYLFLVILSFVFVQRLWSQDLHFSQFKYAPQTFNPALTGSFEGKDRAAVNFRSQWYPVDGGFKTLGLSYDRSLSKYNNFFGGATFYYDQSGIIGLKIAKLLASGSYRYAVLNHELKAGIQAGWVFKQYNANGLITTPDTWDQSTGYFNPALYLNEANLGETGDYPILNAGVSYRHRMLNNILIELGSSVFNLNRPKDYFLKDTLDRSYQYPFSPGAHLIITVPLNSSLSLEPLFMWRNMANTNYILGGADVLLKVPQNSMSITDMQTGLMLRSGFARNIDAIIVHLGYKTFQYDIGLSYDVNISGLHTATYYQGAFELYFVYRGISTKIKPSSIPCYRH